MHKIMEFICDELEELERKAEKDGKLSMAEIQYVDTLAHTKKNLLKADEMWEESEYSMNGGSYEGRGNSYARGGGRSRNSYRYSNENSYARGRGRNANRDSMGRYSSGYSMAGDEMIDELRGLMHEAPDEQTRMEFQRFISKIEKMQ